MSKLTRVVGPFIWGIDSKWMSHIWMGIRRIDRFYGVMLGKNLFLGIIVGSGEQEEDDE